MESAWWRVSGGECLVERRRMKQATFTGCLLFDSPFRRTASCASSASSASRSSSASSTGRSS